MNGSGESAGVAANDARGRRSVGANVRPTLPSAVPTASDGEKQNGGGESDLSSENAANDLNASSMEDDR